MSNILFIGRFQPFHKGHLWVIEQILKKTPQVLIGVGSSQYQNTPNNPFSAKERQQMIQTSLKASGILPDRYKIYQVPDIHDDSQWPAHVAECVKESFSEVWSGRPIVQELFRQARKVRVVAIERQFGISSTVIRHKMVTGDQSWQTMVPAAVSKAIPRLKGVQRLKNLTGPQAAIKKSSSRAKTAN